ncbi:acyltransferase family protein [Desulfovibrio aminophilus]|uniref:acyltransferase family protein n=1 Tax=Desulfovibrio aminophilus TaxID=81425 RepID=UPI003397F38F
MESKLVTAKRAQLDELTGLRFIAAFCILIAHASHWLSPTQPPHSVINWIMKSAGIGMPLFFVLSGFVIHYNYGRMFDKLTFNGYFKYVFARFSRIYPLYFFLLTVALFTDSYLVSLLRQNAGYLNGFISCLTVLHSWFYYLLDGKLLINKIFGLSWSISTEFFFYFAYPFISVFVLNTISGTRKAFIFFLFCMVAPLIVFWWGFCRQEEIYLFMARYFEPISGVQNNSVSRWLWYFSPYSRIFEFIAGVSVAKLYICIIENHRYFGFIQRHLTGAIALAIQICVHVFFVVILFIELPYIQFIRQNFLLAPMISMLMLSLLLCKTAINKIYTSKLMIMLGEASFSIYIIQTWTLKLFLPHLAPYSGTFLPAQWASRVVVAMTYSIVIALGTYKVIELPAKQFLRNLSLQYQSIVTYFGVVTLLVGLSSALLRLFY